MWESIPEGAVSHCIFFLFTAKLMKMKARQARPRQTKEFTGDFYRVKEADREEVLFSVYLGS